MTLTQRRRYASCGCAPYCPHDGNHPLDAGELAMIERVRTLGGAEVYRREWRVAHGLPAVAT